jgi:hypothetical protein
LNLCDLPVYLAHLQVSWDEIGVFVSIFGIVVTIVLAWIIAKDYKEGHQISLHKSYIIPHLRNLSQQLITCSNFRKHWGTTETALSDNIPTEWRAALLVDLTLEKEGPAKWTVQSLQNLNYEYISASQAKELFKLNAEIFNAAKVLFYSNGNDERIKTEFTETLKTKISEGNTLIGEIEKSVQAQINKIKKQYNL